MRPITLGGYGDEQEILKKNEIRRALTTCFPNRDCHVLVRPAADEKKLRNLDTLGEDGLKPLFKL